MNAPNSVPISAPRQPRIPWVRLRIDRGPHQGEEFIFDSYDTLIIGRAADARWRLDKDSFFSRYHFQIEVNPPECWLVDLGSTNGVKVNGQRVQNRNLQDGDQIECGDTVFGVSIVTVPFVTGAAAANHPAPSAANIPTLDVLPDLRPKTAPPPATAAPLASGPIASPPAAQNDTAAPVLLRLPDFDLTRQIGQGGMGVVYHAVQRSTGREAAVKLIRPTAAAPADAAQLFLREATILSQLHHPRIVEYLSLGLHDGQMYLAMEYLPVLDFPALLATQSRNKQIRLACGIVCRVLEALQHAHQRDIVHRDIKPANILAYKQDGRLQVKLADFGLAKNYLHAGLTVLSVENNVRGTLSYIAPEQLLNCRYAKPPCDIYSAGACLYRFLSGKLPFDTENSPSAVGLILNAQARPLTDLAPDVPPDLAAAVSRALAREPADRFSSAEHMRQALLKFSEKP